MGTVCQRADSKSGCYWNCILEIVFPSIERIKCNCFQSVVSSFDMQLITVENTQQYGLCKINNKGNTGLHPQDGFNSVAEKYPQIIENIKKGQN